MTCQDYNNLFIELYYRELSPERRAVIEEHLATCSNCARDYQMLSETLDLMSKRQAVEPDAKLMDGYWESLSQRLDTPAPTAVPRNVIPFRTIVVPRWAYGIAAIFLIALGVYIGRMLPGRSAGTVPDMAASSVIADSTRRDAEREVADYLDRSKSLLLGVVNSENPSPAIIERQQQLSRELVQKAMYLNSTLKDPDDESLRKLIGDLQVVLMQLANYSNETGIPIVEFVRQGVDRKSILLKINVEQIRAMGDRSKKARTTTHNDRKTGI